MSGVFQNIDPSPPGECVPSAFGAGGGHTRWVERGWGGGGQYFGRRQTLFVVVLYIREYFAIRPQESLALYSSFNTLFEKPSKKDIRCLPTSKVHHPHVSILLNVIQTCSLPTSSSSRIPLGNKRLVLLLVIVYRSRQG